jgi:hypothetical protein
MNVLAKKTEKLLQKYPCVIIPSFGGFTKHHKQSYITDNHIFPPQTTVRFNRLLSHEDNLFYGEIMKEKNVSYDVAKKILRRQISNLEQKIRQNKNVSFGKIGVFSYYENLLVFKPFEPDYLPENFAMQPLELKLLNTNNTFVSKKIEIKDNTLIIKLPSSKSNFLRYAASFLAIFTLAIFTPDNSDLHQSSGFFVNNIFTETTENRQNIEVNNIENNFISPDYHLIIASFNAKQDAENFCRNSKFKDELSVLECSKKSFRYRVVFRSFSDYSTAVEEMNSLKKMHKELENAWLFFQPK